MCYFLLLLVKFSKTPFRLLGRSDPKIEGRDLTEDLKLLMSLTLKKTIQLPGCSDLQNQPIVSETPTAQDEASSSNSSGVANADENMDALEIEEPVAAQEEFSQVSNMSILCTSN
jgi:hypothetical protein